LLSRPKEGLFNQEVAGGFSLRTLDASLHFPENKYIIHNPDLPSSTKSILKDAYYFDVQPNVFNELATFIHRKEQETTCSLWYLKYQEVYLLDLDLATYLDMLLLTRGIMHWQLFFCILPSNSSQLTIDVHRNICNKTLNALQQLFPHSNFAPLSARL